MPKCICGGLNPECYMCGGWGWLGNNIQNSRTGWKQEPKPQKVRRKCPYCDKKITYTTLHVSKHYDDKWEEYLL